MRPTQIGMVEEEEEVPQCCCSTASETWEETKRRTRNLLSIAAAHTSKQGSKRETKTKRSRCHRNRAKIFFEKFKTKSILRDVQIIEKGSQKHRVHNQTPKENKTKQKAGKRQVQCVESMTNEVEKSPEEY